VSQLEPVPQLDPGFYDPRDDPRYLGLTREEMREARERLEAQSEAMGEHIEWLRAIDSVLSSEAWSLVEELLQEDLGKVRKAQGTVRDPADFRELKGKAEAFETLLALPLKIRHSLEESLRRVEDLEERGGEE